MVVLSILERKVPANIYPIFEDDIMMILGWVFCIVTPSNLFIRYVLWTLPTSLTFLLGMYCGVNPLPTSLLCQTMNLYTSGVRNGVSQSCRK